MLWPSLYNGFPLLYPDSITYIFDGHLVARALFLHRLSSYYGMRSFLYSLVILPFHWNGNPWPILLLQAALTALVLHLVVRSFVHRHIEATYLAIVAFLSLGTTLSWYVSLIMPDILGPLLYLSVFLLVFAPDTLSRQHRWSLFALIAWAAASHITHLLLAVGLLLLLATLVLLRRTSRTQRLRSLGFAACALAVSTCATLALHGYLYGKPSLNGERPPYLMARLLADGPARQYLEQNCSHLQWVICQDVSRLPTNADDFIWEAGGIWDTASPAKQQQLLQEEMPLVLATLRAYPREQISRSAHNFLDQLQIFGIEDLDASSWVLDQFSTTLPNQRAAYLASRQQRNELPIDLVTSIQNWIVVASLTLIAISFAILWRRWPSRLVWLSVIVVAILLANALLSGVLSMVDDRYQARVVWLLPLLAILALLEAIPIARHRLLSRIQP
jgi:hypothetical protein